MHRTALLCGCLAFTHGAPVVWRASKLVTRTLAVIPGRPLDLHFARPETPAEVLRCARVSYMCCVAFLARTCALA